MAIIYSYPQAIPKDSDLIIGTVTYDPNDPAPVRGNPTRSFRVSDLAASITGNSYTLTSKALGANSSIVLTDNTGFIAGTVNFNSGSGVSALNSGNTITITNTGVLSNIAGTGISLSGTTGNVTITNSGVTGMAITDTTFVDLSLSSATGDVTLTAALSATGTPTNLNFLRGDNVWSTPAGGGTVTSVNSGIGISVDNTDPDNPIINNTGVLSNIAGTGISINNATGNSTITNTAPDQTVVLTGSGGITITGTYPSFNVDSVPGGVITVTAGTNISITGTASDPIINNTAPDQVVTISGAGATSVAGSYPNFTVSSPAIPDLSNYVQGSGSSGQLTMWDSSGNTIENAPIDVRANGDINIGALSNSEGSGFTSLMHTLRMYNRLYTGSTGGSGSNGDVLISTGATTDAQDGLDWSPVADYLKRQTTDISTFNSVDDDVTLGGGSASNTLLASQLAIKTYIDNTAAGSGSLIYQGGYDATTNTPDLTTSPNSILKGWTYAVTVAGDASGFWVPTLGVGDLVIANVDNPTSASDWTEVQSNIDVATDTVLGIANFPTAGGLSVTAGAVSLPVTGVTAGAYTNTNITVDNKGRITAAADGSPGGVTDLTTANSTYVNLVDSGTATQPILTASLSAGSGIATEFLRGDNTWNTAVTSITAGVGLNGGTITTTGTIDLAATAVAPGAYTNANITVDQQGRITVAANGDIGVASFTASSGSFISLSPITLQTGAVTLTSDLSASGTANSNSYLRGDNTWATPVNSLITTNGTYISLTPITAATGAVTVTADLSASGTADNTTFLRGDNQWVTVAGTTYDYSSAQSGDDVNLNLIPSTGTTDTVTLVAGSNITLTDNGSNNVTIAASTSGGGTIEKNDFTGTGSQTQFTLTTAPASILFTDVYINGVYQEKETYSVTGTSLDFVDAPPLNVSIEVMSIIVSNLLPGANTLTTDDFVSTGSLTYTLSTAPPNEDFTSVYVSGVYQEKSTYSVSGTTLTFTEAPDLNDTIEVVIISSASLVNTAPANYNTSVISTSTNASKNTLYVLKADLTLTLPSTPAAGDSIKISNLSGVATCIVARNGNNIMATATDLTLDNAVASFELVYTDATNGWVIIGPQ